MSLLASFIHFNPDTMWRLPLVLCGACWVAWANGNAEAGPTATPPIIDLAGRERLLKEARRSMRRDSSHADWYSKNGERMLHEMLAHFPPDVDGAKAKGGDLDLDGLWLLCRASMGAIEQALTELGQAQARVKRLRRRWQSISASSPSLSVNYAVYGRLCSLRRTLKLGSDRAAVPSHLRRNYELAPLGSGRTRLGLGIRRRALLRSEEALACHAGALHDLRVLLRDVGGQWLELGRWVRIPHFTCHMHMHDTQMPCMHMHDTVWHRHGHVHAPARPH